MNRSTPPLARVTTPPAAAPVPAERATALPTRPFAVDGGTIAYDDTGGPGPLVVAVPGMGDLRSEYRLLRPVLQRAGYRFVTMDVRGGGESSAAWPALSARAVGGDVLRLVEALGAGPAVVLGNSFAAGTACFPHAGRPIMRRRDGRCRPS